MIVRITGQLCEVAEHSVLVERQGVGYEVLVPGFSIGELTASRGREVVLHTLQFFEGSGSGAHLTPRLIGFVSHEDREFFNRFISVKGIGVRKALRALAVPISNIAGWIQEGDTAALSKLPGIGGRAAQLIVAELRDRVTEFVDSAVGAGVRDTGQWSAAQRAALEIMLAWGDARADVERWLERAAQLHPGLDNAEAWVKTSYRIRSGIEG